MPNEIALNQPLPSLLTTQTQICSESLMRRIATSENALVSELTDANPNAPDLVQAITTLSMALETRCGSRTAAVAVAKVSQTLQVQTPPESALEAYYDILSEYPAELVEYATREIIKRHKYPTFPKPADWLAHIEPILEERKRELLRLKRVQDKIRFARKMGERP